MSFKIDRIDTATGIKGIYCTSLETICKTDIIELLALMTKLLNDKKPFTLLADTTGTTNGIEFSYAMLIINWMKANRPLIKDTLLCTTIVIKSKTIASIFNFIFSKIKPVAPNLITTDINVAKKFIQEHS
jgi:hypothetical protein